MLSRLLVAVLLAGAVSAQTSPSGSTMAMKVDHASICGPALDPIREAFAAAGLVTDYGGPHSFGGTHMAILGFDDGSYLELIAPQKPGGAQDSSWSKMMAGNSGPCAWAVGATDIQGEIDRLKKAGIEAKGPFPGSRRKPNGNLIEWQTAGVDSGTPGATLPFFIEDKTPRELRVVPSASVKGGKLTGIKRVVLGVKDQDAAVALFRKAYGWPAPSIENNKEFGAKLAYFAGTPVVLATPLDKDSWLAERLDKFGDAPAAFLLGTSDFGGVAKKMKLTDKTEWFGRQVGWFGGKLAAVRVGVVEE